MADMAVAEIKNYAEQRKDELMQSMIDEAVSKVNDVMKRSVSDYSYGDVNFVRCFTSSVTFKTIFTYVEEKTNLYTTHQDVCEMVVAMFYSLIDKHPIAVSKLLSMTNKSKKIHTQLYCSIKAKTGYFDKCLIITMIMNAPLNADLIEKFKTEGKFNLAAMYQIGHELICAARDELANKIAAKDAEIAASNKEFAAMRKLANDNCAIIGQRDNKIYEMHNKIDKLEHQLNIKNEELDDVEFTITALKIQLADAKKLAKVDAKDDDIAELMQRIDAKYAGIPVEARGMYDRDIIENLKHQLIVYKTSNDVKSAKIVTKDVEIAAKADEINAKNAEIVTKDAEIAIKDAEIAAKDAEIAKLQKLIADYKEDNNYEHHKLHVAKVTNESLDERITILRATNAALVVENNQLSVRLEETQQDLNITKMQVINCQESNDQLTTRIGAVQKERDDAVATIEKLNAQVTNIHRENTVLTVDLEGHKVMLSTTQKDLDDLRATLREYHTDYRKQLDADGKHTSEQLYNCINEVQRLTKEVEQFEAENKRLTMQLGTAQVERAEAQKDRDEALATNKQFIQRNTKLDAHRDELIQQLQRQISDSHEKETTMKKDFESILANFTELTKMTIDKVQADHRDESRQHIMRLRQKQDELDAVEKNHQTSQVIIAQLRGEIDTYKSSVEAYNQQRANQQAELEAKYSNLRDMYERLIALR